MYHNQRLLNALTCFARKGGLLLFFCKNNISISDDGFGIFREFVQYKLEIEGKHFVKIDKMFPSSKLCSHCGYKTQDLTLKDREWICPQCETHHNRDYNAAINIKEEGIRILKEHYNFNIEE